MAKEDSREIRPYKEMGELKKKIEGLQRRSGDTSSRELLDSMAALTKSMNNMLELFSSAAEEMKLEEKAESELSQKVEPLIAKVSNLESQNRTIAEGLVAVANMVKEMRGEKPEGIDMPSPKMPEPSFGEFPPGPEESPLEPPKPPRGPPGAPPFPPHGSPRIVTRNPMPPPGMMPPPRMPPRGPMAPPGLGPLPPLPPLEEEPRKKGFGLFKKK